MRRAISASGNVLSASRTLSAMSRRYRRFSPANPAASNNNVIIVDNRSLSRCDRALRFMQSHTRALILQRRNCRDGTRMVVADFHGGFDWFVVAGGGDPGNAIGAQGAGVDAPGYSVPVHPVDFELVTNQIVGIADDDAICCRIKIDNVTRTRRTSGQPLALSDREQLDPVMFTNEVSIDVVNFAAMKFIFTQMRAQKRLVIVAGNKTNFLAVNLVGDLQA